MSDPGYLPDDERCPATGSAHDFVYREAWDHTMWWACDECGAIPPRCQEAP